MLGGDRNSERSKLAASQNIADPASECLDGERLGQNVKSPLQMAVPDNGILSISNDE
jgi:hypothetical protein